MHCPLQTQAAVYFPTVDGATLFVTFFLPLALLASSRSPDEAPKLAFDERKSLLPYLYHLRYGVS